MAEEGNFHLKAYLGQLELNGPENMTDCVLIPATQVKQEINQKPTDVIQNDS